MIWSPEYRLPKFEQSVIVNLKPISWLFWVYTTFFLLQKLLELFIIYLNYHHMIASVWEKAVSILSDNLNLGCSYLTTTVDFLSWV